MGLDQDSNNHGLHLVLGLSLNNNSTANIIATTNYKPMKPSMNEPSLTLGLAGGELSRQTSPHSVVSSFSGGGGGGGRVVQQVKRERELSSEDAEERVSSRVSDEDEDGIMNARKKLRLTKEQSALLEESFKLHSTLNPKQKQALARQLNLRPRQVEVWFQNRRARTKLKQTEVECEFLKKCCETLTDENRRLKKEVQELKKVAQPLYMHMPAVTLTKCPSCDRLAGVTTTTTNNNNSPFMAAKPHHFYNPSAAC